MCVNASSSLGQKRKRSSGMNAEMWPESISVRDGWSCDLQIFLTVVTALSTDDKMILL